MKKTIQAAAVVLLAVSTAQAQQAVQWRVEDGGNGHWYAGTRIEGEAVWASARELAELIGGHLSCFETVGEFNTIVPPIAANRSLWAQRGNWWRGPWIGGFQDPADAAYAEPLGGWRWVTGSAIDPLLLETIGNGNPNDFPCCEDRLQIGEKYFAPTANDVSSDTSAVGMIVEWSADCNSDGIVDYGQCHDGTLPDYNGNNVPDCCERGEPCAVGNYPVQWRAEDGGNGHWYRRVLTATVVTWSEARVAAEAGGGHLATIASEPENAFVFRASTVAWWVYRYGPWLGGYQDATAPAFDEPAGGWRWVTDEPWAFSAWEPYEPNNGCLADESALHFINYSNQWNDLSDTGLCKQPGVNHFMVEFDADCNSDGIVDYGQILDGTFDDANRNGIPDRVCECLGDFDADGAITGADLGQMLAAWGSSAPGAPADLNADGSIDGFDLAYLLAGWGRCQN